MVMLPWFKKSTGLNNVRDGRRAEWTEKDGMTVLEKAFNVVHDSSGRVSRRKGRRVIGTATNVGSLFRWKEVIYGVVGSKLCSIGVDGVYVELADVDPDYPLAFAGVGDSVYFSNVKGNGVLVGGHYEPWAKSAKSYMFSNSRGYVEPPQGSILCNYKGRMYVAYGRTLIASDPYGLNVYDAMRADIPFDSNIVMVRGVNKGLWVGTELGVYFLADTGDGFFRFSKESEFVAEFGSDQSVDGTYLLDASLAGGDADKMKEVILFVAGGFIFLGTSDGRLMNLTRGVVRLPVMDDCCSVIDYGTDSYIVSSKNLTVCFNLITGAVSQFGNFFYTGMVYKDGKVIAGDGSGLYVIDSDLDGTTAINAYFKLAMTDFGSIRSKRLWSSLVSFQSDGRIKYTVHCDERVSYSREISNEVNDKQTGKRVAGGRNVKGKYFSFEIGNVLGSDFSVDGVDAILVPLGGKI